MNRTLSLKTPKDFDYRQTIISHGWCQLRPFSFDRETWRLKTVLNLENPISIEISEAENGINISIAEELSSEEATMEIARRVEHIFRLDENLKGFYQQAKTEKSLAWIAKIKAGRLLRSPTIYEDLVKTICTTNCSWALTKIMTTNLVEKLGESSKSGGKAFPTAEAMAEKDEKFYREEIRAGYRAPFFIELAQLVAEDKINLKSWLDPALSTGELKKELKKIKGVGNYAAETMLKLLGRYDGLALDSMLRGRFYKKHNNAEVCDDKHIESHYARFGDWRGLAIWCDMTEK